jgi:hypothetical protein
MEDQVLVLSHLTPAEASAIRMVLDGLPSKQGRERVEVLQE